MFVQKGAYMSFHGIEGIKCALIIRSNNPDTSYRFNSALFLGSRYIRAHGSSRTIRKVGLEDVESL